MPSCRVSYLRGHEEGPSKNVAELHPDLSQVRRSKLGTEPPRPRVSGHKRLTIRAKYRIVT